MVVPTSLIVVRIMPKRMSAGFDPSLLFDNFCRRSGEYVFDARDSLTIKPLLYNAESNSETAQLKGDEGHHYAAIIGQDKDGRVVRIGIARIQFIRISKGKSSLEYGIKPIGEPIVLEREPKAPTNMYRTAFAHLDKNPSLQ